MTLSLPRNEPRYVYKIVPYKPEEPFPDAFPFSELDASEGFVHLGTAAQTPTIADLFFGHTTYLWIVKLEYPPLAELIKWETGFPHLYGNFGAAHVQSVEMFSREEDQKWEEQMDGSSWWE